ncbi:winged helix-turn-helix domain-containing protein [Rugosimonospora africana]|uniref:HTH gntR-type domain-containing protein n=1 Tax=Rugosimonospora africana TaxID=556532 RepID=A0A8J3R2Y7_9ACTN|nr:winged helix-turn-helix domain-containing protein [Rugosimonospora africana]GIH20917.1 hypothetical protein Raf01_90890 [Rugosimonospora africana]
MTIDPSIDRPLWKQVADALRADIDAGRIKPGQRLPSELSIQQRTNLSRTTVHKAITQLELEGRVEIRPPKGVFVLPAHDLVVLGPQDRATSPATITVVRADQSVESYPAGTPLTGS